MNTRCDPKELAIALLSRSQCSVQVAAVIADTKGIFAWGWNSSGPDGMGQHAEAHALSRANRSRLPRATIYVAARRRKSKRNVQARPCAACEPLTRNLKSVVWREKSGQWMNKVGCLTAY